VKVLAVSAGLPPRHGGGLSAYVAELLDSLGARGIEILYLNTSGFRPGAAPAIVADHDGPGRAFTLCNAGLTPDFSRGTLQPLREAVPSAAVLAALTAFLATHRPDIIHVHELIGFPVDLLPAMKAQGFPVIFTAQDYYALCPTLKLLLPDRQCCQLPALELSCRHCCRRANTYEQYARTARLSTLARSTPLLKKPLSALRGLGNILDRMQAGSQARNPDYVERRHRFIAALAACDQVVCMSHRQREIFLSHGVAPANVRQMVLSRRTYATGPGPQRTLDAGPLVVAALNAHVVEKGAAVMQREMARLADLAGRLELRLYGGRPKGMANHMIRTMGAYRPEELDGLLAAAHFGLVPSIWWEAYGYVGGEMLTRGLPVIVSQTGAMPEYVRPGQTGLVFDPAVPGDLARVLRQLVQEADLRHRLWSGAQEAWREFEPFESHVDKVLEMYRTTVASGTPHF